MSDSNTIALTASRERLTQTYSGYLMLFLLVLAIAAQIWSIVELGNDNGSSIGYANR